MWAKNGKIMQYIIQFTNYFLHWNIDEKSKLIFGLFSLVKRAKKYTNQLFEWLFQYGAYFYARENKRFSLNFSTFCRKNTVLLL